MPFAFECAKAYSDLGYSVFPCIAKTKQPAVSGGFQAATKDLSQLKEWSDRIPFSNLAIACGSPSGGLLVLDIDGQIGLESLGALELEHGKLPKTPKVITGKGIQYYFRTGASFKNRVGILPGIDIRTDGGYVVAPPSIHPNGKKYEWAFEASLRDCDVASLPEWVSSLFGRQEVKDQSAIPEVILEIAKCGARIGQRNASATRLCGSLMARKNDPLVVLELMLAWNKTRNQPPLSDTEIKSIVNSIASMELNKIQKDRWL